MSKRWMTVVGLVVLAVTAAACSSSNSSTGATSSDSAGSPATNAAGPSSATQSQTPTPVKSLSIGIAGEGNTSTFGAAVDKGLKDEATALGLKNVYFTEAQYDATTQANNVQDLIAKHPDGIVIVATDSGSAAKLVDTITKAGIAVAAVHTTVGTNTTPGYMYPGLTLFLGENEVTTGHTDGELAIKALPNGGKVGVVEGKAGYAAVAQRLDGFKSAIAGHHFTIVASQPGNWLQAPAVNACANMLQAHPDINLFFAEGDNMAIGCEQSVKAAGSKAIVIGNGGSKAGIAGVKSGALYGDVCDKPYTEGKLAMQKFVGVLSGQLKLTKKYVTYNSPAITKDNLSACKPEW